MSTTPPQTAIPTTTPLTASAVEYRNGDGSSILGLRNYARERQAPDMLRPPSTDTRTEEGGWARQSTTRELPTSEELAGVNMRLDEGAIRELQWHKEAE